MNSQKNVEMNGDHESPGVPLFRTWPGVYGFVFGCFVGVVLALTLFTWIYA